MDLKIARRRLAICKTHFDGCRNERTFLLGRVWVLIGMMASKGIILDFRIGAFGLREEKVLRVSMKIGLIGIYLC